MLKIAYEGFESKAEFLRTEDSKQRNSITPQSVIASVVPINSETKGWTGADHKPFITKKSRPLSA